MGWVWVSRGEEVKSKGIFILPNYKSSTSIGYMGYLLIKHNSPLYHFLGVVKLCGLS